MKVTQVRTERVYTLEVSAEELDLIGCAMYDSTFSDVRSTAQKTLAATLNMEINSLRDKEGNLT